MATDDLLFAPPLARAFGKAYDRLRAPGIDLSENVIGLVFADFDVNGTELDHLTRDRVAAAMKGCDEMDVDEAIEEYDLDPEHATAAHIAAMMAGLFVEGLLTGLLYARDHGR